MPSERDVVEAVRAAEELNLPLVTCQDCTGHGKHARRDYVWTREDRESDPEGFEEYMAGGHDVTCETCFGLRVLPEAYAVSLAARPMVRGFVDPYGNIVEMPRADY